MMTRVALAVESLVTSTLLMAAPPARATPDLSAIVNTTCTYQQVHSALQVVDPRATTKLDASPGAQGMLQTFLSAYPVDRQRMVDDVLSSPKSQKLITVYFNSANRAAAICQNY